MWRGSAAVAAAAVVAAGGTAVGLGLTASSAPAWSAASASNPTTHVSAVVDFTRGSAGTDMKVHVNGIQPGTLCQFWVLTKTGAKAWAGVLGRRADQLPAEPLVPRQLGRQPQLGARIPDQRGGQGPGHDSRCLSRECSGRVLR